MLVNFNAEDNGLHLHANIKDGYAIEINFGYENKSYADLNSIACKLFNNFNIEKDEIFINDDSDRLLATIYKDE